MFLMLGFASLTADANNDLFNAAYAGSLDAIQEALSAGAALNAENVLGETALFYAIDECRTEAVQLLVKKGAKLDFLTKLNYTPLMKAAADGCTAIVQLLLREKIDINRAEPQKKHTALMKAVLFNHLEIVEILLNKGARVDFPDKFGNTPLMLAVQNGNFEIAEFLISQGADVNAKTLIGYTPLLYALEFGQLEIAEILVDNGAKANVTDKDNYSPLMYAASRGYSDLVEAFVAAGVDLNIKNKKEETAATLAQKNEFDDIVTFLLEHGADSTGLVFVDSTALAEQQAMAEMYDTPPEPIGGLAAVQKKLRYPKAAKDAGLQGSVKIKVTVDSRGRVRDTEIIESFGDDECDKAAQRAIQGARWKAAEKEKKKVEAWVEVSIEFKLDES